MERANGHLETSFLPGRGFASPQDFNAQLSSWLDKANGRVHRGIDAKPTTVAGVLVLLERSGVPRLAAEVRRHL